MTTKNDLKKIYKKPIPSTRGGALYNAVSYPTKISPEVIAVFIATHTSPGDIVLDTFGGSGTTGLGVMLCDKPNKKAESIAKKLNVKPKWGARKAIIYELSSMGSFIGRTLGNPKIDPKVFMQKANLLIDSIENEYGDLYSVKDPDGNTGTIRHVIWTDEVACSKCGHRINYFDAVVEYEPLNLQKTFRCKKCKELVDIKEADKIIEEFYDPVLQKKIARKKRRARYIYGITGKRYWQRAVSQDDLNKFDKINRECLAETSFTGEINWGDLYRSGYHKGITHLHHFYTPRNYFLMNKLWNALDGFDEDYRAALRLLVLSYNASHATLMSRVVVKSGQKDFILTGAQSGVLYISSLPVEKNVLLGLRRKAKSISKAFSEIYGSESTVEVHQKSSRKLKLKSKSIDYVFTDPPFGDYIPYAEINQINEIWLKDLTNREEEIIVSDAQEKSIARYSEMMTDVMKEIERVLKKSGRLTLVFHSARSEIWKSLTQAYLAAGLYVETTSILDKIQDSFKQVVSTVSVKGDPLILLSKEKRGASNLDLEKKSKELMNLVIEEIDNKKLRKTKGIEHAYSMFINKCLESGTPINVDAKEFYTFVRKKLSD